MHSQASAVTAFNKWVENQDFERKYPSYPFDASYFDKEGCLHYVNIFDWDSKPEDTKEAVFSRADFEDMMCEHLLIMGKLDAQVTYDEFFVKVNSTFTQAFICNHLHIY